MGGSRGKVQVWDTSANAGVRRIFGDQLKAIGKDLDRSRENGGVYGVERDENESGDEEPED